MKSGTVIYMHNLTCRTSGSKFLSVDTHTPFPYTHLKLRHHFPGFSASKNQTCTTTAHTHGFRTPAL